MGGMFRKDKLDRLDRLDKLDIAMYRLDNLDNLGSKSDRLDSNLDNLDNLDSDLTIETIHTIKINLSKNMATIVMNIMYGRLDVPVDEVKILIEGINFTIFLIKNRLLKNQLLDQSAKSNVKYTD